MVFLSCFPLIILTTARPSWRSCLLPQRWLVCFCSSLSFLPPGSLLSIYTNSSLGRLGVRVSSRHKKKNKKNPVDIYYYPPDKKYRIAIYSVDSVNYPLNNWPGAFSGQTCEDFNLTTLFLITCEVKFLPSNFLSSKENSSSRISWESYSEAVYEYSPKTFKQRGSN